MRELNKWLARWLRSATPLEWHAAFFSYSHASVFDGPFVERVYDATTALGARNLLASCERTIAAPRLMAPASAPLTHARAHARASAAEWSRQLMHAPLACVLP